MARRSKQPTILEECRQLRMEKLREWNYLKPNQIVTSTICWNRHGVTVASIEIKLTIADFEGVLELKYNYRNEPINYNVQVSSVSSNIGSGRVWYFVCPKTKARCRALHLIGGFFFHRSAFTGCCYEKQTFSRNTRLMCNKYEMYFAAEKAYSEIHGRYFRKLYKGKVTKRYRKTLEAIAASEKILEEELY